MQDPNQTVLWWFETILYGLFAGIGGVIGYLSRTIQNGTSIAWPRALLEGLSAAFIGLIVTFICDAVKLDPCWTGAIVGVSGWVGATSSVKIVEFVLSKKFGMSVEQIKDLSKKN